MADLTATAAVDLKVGDTLHMADRYYRVLEISSVGSVNAWRLSLPCSDPECTTLMRPPTAEQMRPRDYGEQ